MVLDQRPDLKRRELAVKTRYCKFESWISIQGYHSIYRLKSAFFRLVRLCFKKDMTNRYTVGHHYCYQEKGK